MNLFLKYIILPLFLIIFGISIGIIIRDFPRFSLDYNVKITDILKLILTFGIGVFIPLLVKRLIEDKKSFKNSLIEEVSSFNKITSRINERLATVHSSSKLTQKNKDSFVLLFEISDEEFNELCDFIIDNSNSDIKTHIENLQNKYIEYWKTLTGSEVTSSEITRISDSTFRKASKLFTEIKSLTRKIKTSIIKM